MMYSYGREKKNMPLIMDLVANVQHFSKRTHKQGCVKICKKKKEKENKQKSGNSFHE